LNGKDLQEKEPKLRKSITKLTRPVRRRLKRVVRKSKDRRYARRAHAILLLHEGYTVSEVSRLLSAARSAAQDWRKRFERLGEVVPERRGASRRR